MTLTSQHSRHAYRAGTLSSTKVYLETLRDCHVTSRWHLH